MNNCNLMKKITICFNDYFTNIIKLIDCSLVHTTNSNDFQRYAINCSSQKLDNFQWYIFTYDK